MKTVVSTVLKGRNCVVDLTRPRIMGVLNVTPDSFSDGGCYLHAEAAVQQGLRLQSEGADIIDVGGESTRPGAPPVSPEQELERIIPVIAGLRCHSDVPISVDTNKSLVAREAVAAGANFVNDISGGSFDILMFETVAASGAGLVLMHTRGTPATMQQNTTYVDLVAEVEDFLRQAAKRAIAAGVGAEYVAIDPGIGFGKSAVGNLLLLNQLGRFHDLGYPLLLGTSRKSFIGTILKQDDPAQRLYGTLATVAVGVGQRVQLFRVHDVREVRETALVAWAIREQQLP